MRNCWKSAVTSLAVIAIAGTAGCGSGGGEDDSSSAQNPVTAAIAGSGTSPTGAKSTQPTEDPLHPIVLLDTTLGKVTVELDAEKAPLTAGNFLHYVDEGFYDQTIFHQALPGDIVLGGGYTDDLSEKKPEMPIRNEAHNGLKNTRGTLAMVRRPDSTDSATSQFFFNLADNPRLDYQGRTEDKYGYCVFGRVIDGMDVIEKIGQVDVEDTPEFPSKPVKTVLIKSARRIR